LIHGDSFLGHVWVNTEVRGTNVKYMERFGFPFTLSLSEQELLRRECREYGTNVDDEVAE